MFEIIETIGNLLAIGFWIVAIAAFIVGIIACIYKLIKTTHLILGTAVVKLSLISYIRPMHAASG